VNGFSRISVAQRSVLARLVAELSVKRNLLAITAGSIVLITNVSVFLNLPAVREISGFLFLTLLPGMLLVQLLKLREFGLLGKFVLSWGLSLAFIMLYTLLLNAILPQIGYATPLSSLTLLISYDLALLLLGVLYYRTSNAVTVQFSFGEINLSNAYLYLIPLFFPLLSVLGSYAMRAANINSISIALLFLIGFYVTYVLLFLKDKCPKSLYPVLIFSIGLSIMLLFTLRSNHLVGWDDLHNEYYFYESILGDHYVIFGSSPQAAASLYAGVASILLPVVYQFILGADREALFNVIYALLFSVGPLVVYLISKKYVEERYALVASLLFMFQTSFGLANTDSRATIAILFFAFAFLVLFGSEKRSAKEFALFSLFVTAGIISHYSTAYLFLMMLITAVILLAVLPTKNRLVTRINVTVAVLFFSVTFLWYAILTASSSITNALQFVRDAVTGFLFDFWAQRAGAQHALGVGIAEKGLLQRIEFGLSWAIVICVLLGVATLVIKRKEMVANYAGSAAPTFLRARFEPEYFVLALAATGLLGASVAVPHFALVYGLDRVFFFVTTILSVFFVIGTIILSAWVIAILKAAHRKLKGKSATAYDGHVSRRGTLQVRPNVAIALALIIIVPYLLISSGAIYGMTGPPRGWVFESTGETYFEHYIYEQDSAAAKWLATFGQTQARISTTDFYGPLRLVSQGHISPNYIDSWSFQQNRSFNTYTYLYYYNTVEQKYVIKHPGSPDTAGDMADHIALLSNQSRVFDAAGAQVYFKGSPT
jgi:uncharacterized membrane protein